MAGLTEQEIELIAQRIVADMADRGGAGGREKPPGPSKAAELGIFDSIDEAVRAAGAAFRQYDDMGLAKRSSVVAAIRSAMREHSGTLAREAHEETGLGRYEAAYALGESGLAPDHSMARAADWLLTKEVRRRGDWSVKRPSVEPSGWYFEFANEFYPDIDDTAQVLLALARARGTDAVKQDACLRRAVDWLLAMQSKDGGWAAFDVDNNWQFLSSVPFADHNAMLDPTCPDITGRVLEALGACGVQRDPRSEAGR